MTIKCPCGSNNSYDNCCGQFILHHQIPSSALQLMRSRYTAYTQGNISYIQTTMKGSAALNFNVKEAKDWSLKVIWLDLTILGTSQILDNQATIHFKARYIENNQLCFLKEKSIFEKFDSKWYYTSGTPTFSQKAISKNGLCPCGSNKKFKRCCYKQ
jgi:SEC-C motif domain protein